MPLLAARGAQQDAADLRPALHGAGTAGAVRRAGRAAVGVIGTVDVAARDAHRFIGERREGDGKVDRVTHAGPDRGRAAYAI